jgi:membrane-associated phospholipid phosphatase
MRNLSSTNSSPLARYSLWCLLLLLGHLFLIHLDRVIYDLMQGVDPRIYVFFRAVTEIGDSKWTLVPTGVLALVLFAAGRYVLSNYRIAAMCRWLSATLFFIFASIALSGIAANIIKSIIGRGRPKLLGASEFTGFDPFTLNANFHSFPSGHTNTAFALALAVSFLIPRWRNGLFALAAVVGFSRLVVGAHFLTDVVGGAVLALVTTYWLRRGFASFGLVFARNGKGEYATQWPGRLLPVALGRYIRRTGSAGEPAPRRADAQKKAAPWSNA